MDSNTVTHVAAIVVGVLVTLVLVGSFSSKPVDDSTSNKSVSANNNNNSSEGQSKKKKKKKSKAAKKSTATNSGDSTEEPSAAAAKKEEEAAGADKENANTANNSNNNGGKKKAKKKKNKAGGAANGSNGAAAKEKEANNTSNGGATPAAAATAKPTPATTASNNIGTWQTPAPVEEEWNSVGDSKKKKKKATVKTASVTASTTATPAAAAATTTDSITVDAKKIGIIIGPKGATMIALQEATGCKLDINAPSKDDAPNNRATKAGVVITGPDKESIQAAKKAVQELATKGYATILQSENFGEYGTEVHPRYLSEIVGPNGRTIQAIQKTLSVKITIPPTDWKPNRKDAMVVKPALVGIAGSKDNAKTAKAVIQSLVKYHHHEITHPGMIHEEVHVPREFFHCVIGIRGSEIKHIRGNYKVDLYMPNEDSVSENVLVVGRQANVDKAISYIQLLMDRDAESRDQKYSDEYY